MKKFWIALISAVMLLALGTAVYAAADEDSGFKEMLPFMQKMHPDVSEKDLQEMYNSCHSNGKGMSGMMNGHMGNMTGHGNMHNMMNPPAAEVQ